jgi:transposase-like protein/IS1 family transposase
VITVVCQHENRRTNGKTPSGATRFRCKDCGKGWTEETAILGGMRIGLDKASQIVTMLCEGVSVRATARMTGTDQKTILELLTMIGERCEEYMQENIRGVFVGECQVDELWSFVLCKAATAKKLRYVGGCGDNYCFTAIDRQTKLLITWQMGKRTEQHTETFICKLEAATAGHMHISSDGWKSYPPLIKQYLGHRCDHGVLQKIYGRPINYPMSAYSPARIIGATRSPRHGDVYQQDKICTSHVERMNGSIRNFVKRMGRLTYCFSKKWANHRAALAVFFCHYNYCRTHKALGKLTPAMSHGLTTEVWSVRRMIEEVSRKDGGLPK